MNYTDFLLQASNLKKTVRTGWTYHDIPEPESVADHSYNVALIALTIDLPKGTDRNKLVQMAILHDLAESQTGDIVYRRAGVSKEEVKATKIKKETEVLTKFFTHNPPLLKLALEEYDSSSPEAQILAEIDKLEMVTQALLYEKQENKELPEFWITTEKVLKTPAIIKIFAELKSMRA